MKSAFRRRAIVAVVLLFLAAAILPPFVNLSRFSARIAGSLSNALGRPVTVGNVSFRIFPRPGFNLENLVVADDPAISHEPMLHADQVAADLRLSSLWRGRLEIARLSLTAPSLNLVRAENGHWNLESILERASSTPTAPTGKTRPEARPRFPYVEAEGGRINIKLGVEKKPYALTDTDFALSLVSENEWRIRLEGHPLRTDSHQGDAGLLKMNIAFQRAPTVRDTPVDIQMDWKDAQLGQVTSLVYGRDRGWRGTLHTSAHMKGTPAALRFQADATVDDFRRYDIYSSDSLQLQIDCSGLFSSIGNQVSGVSCTAPLGGGTIGLRGDMRGILHRVDYNWSVSVENVSAQGLVALLRRAKKDLPEDLSASGTLDAAVKLRRASPDEEPVYAGAGVLAGLQLQTRELTSPLVLEPVHLLFRDPSQAATPRAPLHKLRARSHSPEPAALFPAEPFLEVRAFGVKMGGSQLAQAEGGFARSGYKLRVRGEMQVARTQELGRALGLRPPATPLSGAAEADVSISGPWTGFAAPHLEGTAQLRQVAAKIVGIASPVRISGNVVMSGDQVALQKMVAVVEGSPFAVTGWISWPRECPAAPPCPATFQLHSDQLSLEELNRVVNPHAPAKKWYQVLSPSQPKVEPFLAKVRGSGDISVGKLAVRGVTVTHVTTKVDFNAGLVTLSDLRGELLGGEHRGIWKLDFSGAEPSYLVKGALDHVAMDKLSFAMHQDWAAGTANVVYEGEASGLSAAQLRDTATGTLRFDWRNGELVGFELGERGERTRLSRFQGVLNLQKSVFTLADNSLQTPSARYQLTGTVSLDRHLQLKLAGQGPRSYSIEGTLQKPRIVLIEAPQKQALLKP